MKNRTAIIFLVIGVTMAVFSFSQVVSALIGVPFLMVTSGYSMVPILEPFDLIIMEPIQPDQLEIGMIVAVDHREGIYPFGGYIVHRLHEIEEKERPDGLWVRTKGDANEGPDERVLITDVKTKLIFSIPLVGFVLGPPVNVLIILAFLFLAFRSFKIKKPTGKGTPSK